MKTRKMFVMLAATVVKMFFMFRSIPSMDKALLIIIVGAQIFTTLTILIYILKRPHPERILE
jgi:uncharacterized membrane protein